MSERKPAEQPKTKPGGGWEVPPNKGRKFPAEVLRKLKDRHDVRATALEEFSEQLLSSWDTLDADNQPERSLALIDDEIAAKKNEDLV